ncbi:MAG: hypothetical protein D6740_04190 [Alphaproteobacteria bacterium]|nr:MAG: hypothetical protein D6740_04190 [Alphaproteobacteria bacterium]
MILDRGAWTFQGPLGASPWHPSLGFAIALGVFWGWRAFPALAIGFLLAALVVWDKPLGLSAFYDGLLRAAVTTCLGRLLARDEALCHHFWPLASVLRFLGWAVVGALVLTVVENLPYAIAREGALSWGRLSGWAAGDFVGIFVFAPAAMLLLAWLRNGKGRWSHDLWRRLGEFALYLIAAAGLMYEVLLTPWGWHYNLLFLSFIIVIVAAIRLGFAGAVWIVTLIDAAVLLTVGLTRAEAVMTADHARLYILQLFIATLAGAGFILGSTIEGYRRLRDELTTHRDRLEEVVAERTRQLAAEVEERRRAQAALAEANRLLESRLDEREQALLAAKREAEEASRAKTRFLQNVSHELRTPLNAILGFGGMVTSEIHGAIRPAVYGEYVRHIVEAGEHLRALVERLLNVEEADDISRFTTMPVDSLAVVRSSMELMEPHAESRGVRLQLAESGPLPPVEGEPARLRQILLNLLDNAIKYGPAGGLVRVVLTPITETEEPDAPVRWVEIAVEDEGPGVPPALRDRIFERFGRLHDADTANAPGGLGIGLYLVRRILHAMGGEIRVEAAPGGGARFVVRLRVASAPEKP